jgi:hypothetical protein
LGRLPGSRLSHRMQARLLPLLHIVRLPGLRRLDLTLSAEHDAAMQRDDVGEKSEWVIDILAAVDPRHWSTHFECAPRECLALATPGDAGGILVRGWALLATAHHAMQDGAGLRAWIEAIARTWTEADPALRDVVPREFLESLAAALSVDMQDMLVTLLDAFPGNWFGDTALLQLMNMLVEQSSLAWPATPSRSMLQLLERALASLSSTAYSWMQRQLLTNLELVIDSSSAIDAESAWLGASVPDDTWRGVPIQFFDSVRFRQTMALSF